MECRVFKAFYEYDGKLTNIIPIEYKIKGINLDVIRDLKLYVYSNDLVNFYDCITNTLLPNCNNLQCKSKIDKSQKYDCSNICGFSIYNIDEITTFDELKEFVEQYETMTDYDKGLYGKKLIEIIDTKNASLKDSIKEYEEIEKKHKKLVYLFERNLNDKGNM